MSLFDKVRAWIAPKSPATEAEEKLHLLVDAALKIIAAYGDAIESAIARNQGLTSKYSEAELPYSKQIIRKSVIIMQQTLWNPSQRAILIKWMSPMEAQYVLSPKFEASLGAGLVMLDSFVPIAEVEAERKQWSDVYKTMDQIDPAWREQLENKLQRAKSPEGWAAMKLEPEAKRVDQAINQVTKILTPEEKAKLNFYDPSDPKMLALKERIEKEVDRMFKSGEMDHILKGESDT